MCWAVTDDSRLHPFSSHTGLIDGAACRRDIRISGVGRRLPASSSRYATIGITSVTKTTRSAVTTITYLNCWLALLGVPAHADISWNGSTSNDWSIASNWSGGTPSDSGAGNTVITAGSPHAAPSVSTMGNKAAGQVYIGPGGGLNVTAGGQLTTTDLVTGALGNSGGVIVTGGLLTISGYLNLGAGGKDGKIDISGGIVRCESLSINASGGASMNISDRGTFVTTASQLDNVKFWVAHAIIKAHQGAPGWSINVDTTTEPGKVVLTAVPPKPAAAAAP
jgi:hypothetical protein